MASPPGATANPSASPTATASAARQWGNGTGRSCSLRIYLWPPHSKSRIHNHPDWGALVCVHGELWEERYKHLGRGFPNLDSLKFEWRRGWKKEDGISTVLPGRSLHRLENTSDSMAITLNLYDGPNI